MQEDVQVALVEGSEDSGGSPRTVEVVSPATGPAAEPGPEVMCG